MYFITETIVDKIAYSNIGILENSEVNMAVIKSKISIKIKLKIKKYIKILNNDRITYFMRKLYNIQTINYDIKLYLNMIKAW